MVPLVPDPGLILHNLSQLFSRTHAISCLTGIEQSFDLFEAVTLANSGYREHYTARETEQICDKMGHSDLTVIHNGNTIIGCQGIV
jgi:peptide methionine sulfoxide reductase MsrA